MQSFSRSTYTTFSQLIKSGKKTKSPPIYMSAPTVELSCHQFTTPLCYHHLKTSALLMIKLDGNLKSHYHGAKRVRSLSVGLQMEGLKLSFSLSLVLLLSWHICSSRILPHFKTFLYFDAVIEEIVRWETEKIFF